MKYWIGWIFGIVQIFVYLELEKNFSTYQSWEQSGISKEQ